MDPERIYGRLPAEECQPPNAGDDSRLSDRLNGGNGAGDFSCDIMDAPGGDHHLTTPRCAQCRAGRPDDPPTVPVTTQSGGTVYVHTECLRFWKKGHGDAPVLGNGDVP
jgi:hypothetical protein